jgi:hypothetical protein
MEWIGSVCVAVSVLVQGNKVKLFSTESRNEVFRPAASVSVSS